jgi:hypothetical protein
MKPRYSIRDVLWLTLVVAGSATICRSYPTFELREYGGALRMLYPRDPSLAEFAICLAWLAPLVLGYLHVRSRLRKLPNRK